MAAIHELGKQGEELAARYLTKKGYKILETNWHFGRNELDLIAEDGDILVVVEVKTRQSNVMGDPEMAVTWEKQRAIIRSANAYVRWKRRATEVRFDILSVLIRGEKVKINHIPDAFYPMAR
ncbi:MAG: YraN family protein [Bacteroidales bacterium]|nr:YraN family protein [Bacteroidales bacterium]